MLPESRLVTERSAGVPEVEDAATPPAGPASGLTIEAATATATAVVIGTAAMMPRLPTRLRTISCDTLSVRPTLEPFSLIAEKVRRSGRVAPA